MREPNFVMFAKLDGKEVVPCSLEEYAAWMAENPDITARRVGLDEDENCKVSTVFLAVNHGNENYPLWFETMVFDKQDKRQAGYGELSLNELATLRCATYEKALEQHAQMVEKYLK